MVIEAAGWYGRILQHEIDHLHGRLHTDIMQPEALTTIDHHQRNTRRQPQQNDVDVNLS